MQVNEFEKNYDYINQKLEKTLHELKFLKKSKCRQLIVGSSVLGGNGDTNSFAVSLKNFQLNLLGWIIKAPVSKIITRLHSTRKKLCVEYLKTLEYDYPSCSNDLRHFIKCSMLQKSLMEKTRN